MATLIEDIDSGIYSLGVIEDFLDSRIEDTESTLAPKYVEALKASVDIIETLLGRIKRDHAANIARVGQIQIIANSVVI